MEKYDEVVLVWDVYKENYIKKRTRINRLNDNTPVRYQVRNSTKPSHLSMTSILWHDDTKNDLIKNLSHETFEINKTSTKHSLYHFPQEQRT